MMELGAAVRLEQVSQARVCDVPLCNHKNARKDNRQDRWGSDKHRQIGSFSTTFGIRSWEVEPCARQSSQVACTADRGVLLPIERCPRVRVRVAGGFCHVEIGPDGAERRRRSGLWLCCPTDKSRRVRRDASPCGSRPCSRITPLRLVRLFARCICPPSRTRIDLWSRLRPSELQHHEASLLSGANEKLSAILRVWRDRARSLLKRAIPVGAVRHRPPACVTHRFYTAKGG